MRLPPPFLCLLFHLLMTLGSTAFAQNYQHTAGVNVFKGFIYLHTNKIGHLITDHPGGIELYYNKQTNGRKDWESIHNYPIVGYSLGYYNYGNDTLGKTISALTYIQYYLFSRREPHNLKLHMGTGLGFNTHPYDPDDNNKNTILGSVVTFSIQVRLIYTYSIKNWEFSLAPNLTHFSNGSIRQPNKGINVISLNAGVARKIGNSIPYTNPHPQIDFDRKLQFNLAAYSGVKNNVEGGAVYPFLTLQTFIARRFTAQSGANAGLDVFFSKALKQEIEDNDQLNGDTPNSNRVGLMAGYEYYIGQISLVGQLGYYLYRPYKDVAPFYQRLGIKYHTGRLFFAANLKTHAANAEFAEFGMGVKL